MTYQPANVLLSRVKKRAVGAKLGGSEDVVNRSNLALAHPNASLFDQPAGRAFGRGQARFSDQVHNLQARDEASAIHIKRRQG
jgi:hypothetical protein